MSRDKESGRQRDLEQTGGISSGSPSDSSLRPETSASAATQRRRRQANRRRALLYAGGVLALLMVASIAAGRWYASLRQARVDEFMEVDERYGCCEMLLPGTRDVCTKALGSLVELSAGGDIPASSPSWLPGPVGRLLDQARGADPAGEQAVTLFWQCPMAHEIVVASEASPAEVLCGLMATTRKREYAAREASRRGSLVAALTHLECSPSGFDIGLKQIQVDFLSLCEKDACLDLLLSAPATSQGRVREIVAAHPDAVLTALTPRLFSGSEETETRILSFVLGRDARALAALCRGDLSELELASILDLIELPLNPRKVFILRHVRRHSAPEAAAVAAVFLDAAEAARATQDELRLGLLTFQKHQCAILERAIQRLDLGAPRRADAALPALRGCPKAAQLALADAERLTMTQSIMEAALKGEFNDVEEILIDRLDRGSVADLDRFLALARREAFQRSAEPIAEALRMSAAARFRALESALGVEEWEEPATPAAYERARVDFQDYEVSAVRDRRATGSSAGELSRGDELQEAPDLEQEMLEPLPIFEEGDAPPSDVPEDRDPVHPLISEEAFLRELAAQERQR